MSSRLPIGVGQTISRPAPAPLTRANSSNASAAAPSSPASAPKRAGTISTMSRSDGIACSATSRRAGSSSSSPAAMPPPPTRIRCGLKTFTSVTMPAPRARPTRSMARLRDRVAVVRKLGDERAGDLTARARLPCERRLRVVAR